MMKELRFEKFHRMAAMPETLEILKKFHSISGLPYVMPVKLSFEKFHQMAAMPDLHDKMRRSMAPSIFGHDMIKKALACQLMGGSRKALPDGARLRGKCLYLYLFSCKYIHVHK